MSHRELLKHEKDGIFCLQGEAADGLFVLRRGRVGVYINGGVRHPTAEQVLKQGICVAILEDPGGIIGEGGVFLRYRTASLVALEAETMLDALHLGEEGLQGLMRENAAISMKLCRSLANRLSGMNQEVARVAGRAESLSRAYDNLACEYYRLIELLRTRGAQNPALQKIVERLDESPFYFQGMLVEQGRRTTLRLFKSANQQRAGNLTLQPGQVLCEAGDLGRSLYLVRSGLLSVEVGQTEVSRIGPDEVVGEIAAILKETPKRTATVRALAESTLYCIPTIRFQEQAQRDPAILIPIARSLAARLDATNQMMSDYNAGTPEKAFSFSGEGITCESYFVELQRATVPYEELASFCRRAQSLIQTARELGGGSG